VVSTYTGNLGVEKPGSGDQAGTWGTTTNNNFDIFDRAIAGVGAITLSSTSHTLSTTDGVLSDGGFRVLVLGGSPSGTNTITISPNDQDKVYLVDNRSGQSVIFTQGSGGNDTLVNGEIAWIFADGAGASAAVKKASLLVSQITDLTATAAELNIMDGVTATTSELNIMDGVTATTSELNIMDGVTATAAELNYSDTGASTGVVVADKVVTVDSNKDVASFRNITLTGELDAGSLDVSGNADIDGTLEADAMTLNGTAITTTATLSTGISNTNVLQCNANVVDDDFLRIDGTSVEGRSASEVLSDIGALGLTGGTVSGQVTITTADNNAQLTLLSTDDDSSAGPRLDLKRDSASPADDDTIGRIRFMFDNDAAEETRACVIDCVANDVSDGSEDGTLRVKTMTAGSVFSRLEALPTETVLNEDAEAFNTRIESKNDANMFFVDATNDKVGIGTNSPSQVLEISGASPIIRLTDTGASNNFSEINADYTSGSIQISADTANASSNSRIIFAVDNSEKMRITSDGSVGIGTISPVSNSGFGGLTLNGDDGSILSLKDSDTEVGRVVGSATELSFQYGTSSVLTFKDGLSGGTERMRLDSSGRLLVKCTSFPSSSVPGTAISNTGDGSFTSFGSSTGSETHGVFGNTNGIVGTIRTSGSSTSYNTSSDHRLKEAVVYMTGAIDRVKALAPKRFNFIADADTTVDGFIAHEAQAVVPEAVTGTHNEVETWTQQEIDDGDAPDGTSAGDNKLDGDGNTIPVMQGIDQSKLVPLLTGALQEAIAKIETLETEMTELKARVTALEA